MLFILTLISYFLIALLLMNMFAKARPKIKEPLPGKKIKALPMNLVSRLQLQRSSLLALVLGIVLGLATGWLSAATAGIVAALAILALFIPMQYTFTTRGVALGDGIFYPWDDFSGFVAGETRLQLMNSSLFGRLTLFVKPAEMPGVLPVVERYVNTGK
jgi:hypothetical protein